ncbi:nitroreductase family protein [uncultured Arcticibacterium sp.]|uniref:nitroreductase family protein n=1 Tax=uncultured Arcticibacterium sp. TaxID=2173042 RepID=UPI0030F8063A
MTFKEIVESRRSIRKFDTEHVFKHERVTEALRLAILSPNSSNLQTWEFYRVKSADKLKELSEACLNQGAARTASEMVVFVSRQDLWEKRANWNAQQIKNKVGDRQELSKREKRGIHYYETMMKLFYDNSLWPLNSIFRRLVLLWRVLNGKPMMRFTRKQDSKVVSNKSVAIAAQTFMLAMKDQGYDTCPMEGFDSAWVRKALDLPKSADVSIIVACGKGLPEGITNERLRLPYGEVVFEV